MASHATLTLQVPPELKQQFEQLAKETGRSEELLAREAFERYLEVERWQLEEIRAGLREVEAGDFADPGEAQAMFAKWARPTKR